jgi:WD40 repeat protein
MKRQLLVLVIFSTVGLWSCVDQGERPAFVPSNGGPHLENRTEGPDPEDVGGTSTNGAQSKDLALAVEIRRFRGHTRAIYRAIFSHDGKTVLTSSADGSARIWDAGTGKQIHKFERIDVTALERVPVAMFSPDSKKVLTLNDDNTARLWDAVTGKELHRLVGHTGAIRSIDLSSCGRYALTAGLDGTARTWSVQTGQELNRFEKPPIGPNETAAFAPDGTQVLTTGEVEVCLWDAAEGRVLHTLAKTSRPFSSDIGLAVLSPDGKLVLTTGLQPRLWDAATGKVVSDFEKASALHWQVVRSANFSPDCTQLLTQDLHQAYLWDAATGMQLRKFESPSHSAVFSPDGKQILSADSYQQALLWNASTGKLLRKFDGHSSDVPDRMGYFSAVFSPDGRQVLTGGTDRTAILWGHP